jgi:hypothetical protein
VAAGVRARSGRLRRVRPTGPLRGSPVPPLARPRPGMARCRRSTSPRNGCAHVVRAPRGGPGAPHRRQPRPGTEPAPSRAQAPATTHTRGTP